ncbi:aspartate aminotransferase family protein [Desulfosporosinus sp. BICA1-9]|uniref:aspartate aminotransferase family protein n=1 Tax=Desulfosporosinus sp. BICA1-9 TaxID=1531958 RepID=UPI00054B3A12|nr:aspartate aminotransferase family protein [Desulfosporosinus sp. BICA1-9]KJS50181.1 MAG: acetylornithine aminotransferase [Peptococcaceae bacterium BRH_c23]KJS86107.1 MAG: acetylornithine aminotransferase [Desulfosporosinus sp. BICA1-9]HBW34375.1 aspartate aminotransferase family protein [Desulfosporosinus sp.]
MLENLSTDEIISRGKVALMNTYNQFPIALTKGEGVWVWDADCKRYLDFVTGIAVNSLGHSHPKVVETIRRQAGELLHTSNLYWIPNQVALAELLIANSFADKVFFCNSGGEANEGAMKLARKYAKKNYGTHKYEVVSLTNSFHGRTLATLTATGQPKYHKGYEPLPAGFSYVALNDIEALQSAVNENTAALLIEPIQGEGGVNPATEEFLQKARELCDRYHALLIFDEVQCGVGRTGKLFSHQWSGVTPDIMTLAKALGGGVSIGAIMATAKVAVAFEPGDHGTTLGGNPLAMAVGCTVLEVMLADGFLEGVVERAEYLRHGLDQIAAKYGVEEKVRGQGMMLGLTVGEKAPQIVDECRKNGLLINCVGGKTFRFLPPLTVEKVEIDEALAILDDVFSKLG